MWSKEEKTKSYSILCQEFVSVFLPKIELIPAGYPCVGWLLLLTRRYSTQMPANMASTSCLWLYAGILPPDEKKEAQNGVSTSAILGLLQNAITTFAFWLFFFFFLRLLHRDKEKAAVVVPSTVRKPKKKKTQGTAPDNTQLPKLRTQLQSQRKTQWTYHLSHCVKMGRKVVEMRSRTESVKLRMKQRFVFNTWEKPRFLIKTIGLISCRKANNYRNVTLNKIQSVVWMCMQYVFVHVCVCVFVWRAAICRITMQSFLQPQCLALSFLPFFGDLGLFSFCLSLYKFSSQSQPSTTSC